MLGQEIPLIQIATICEKLGDIQVYAFIEKLYKHFDQAIQLHVDNLKYDQRFKEERALYLTLFKVKCFRYQNKMISGKSLEDSLNLLNHSVQEYGDQGKTQIKTCESKVKDMVS